MYALGMIMAKSGSTRTPNKNITDINGKPLLAYPIESLKNSKVVNKVVVSTDSPQYADLAMKHGADAIVIRDPEWDTYPEFSVCADNSRRKYQAQTGHRFDSMIIVGANVIFLRPSWIRAAHNLLNNYLNHKMPIDNVTIEHSRWNVCACRIRKGIMRHPKPYIFKHVGLLLEIDWQHEITLARQIAKAIQSRAIHYPLDEPIHDDILTQMESSPNRMSGLSLRHTAIT